MGHYTFIPEKRHSKAYGRNLRISAKKAAFLCRVIRGKPLNRAKRLLEDMISGRRSLEGRHYTKTAEGLLSLLKSCEKNAVAAGLDTAHLVVHGSAHKGTNLRRRRRKQGFGFRMKSANVEIMLTEKVPHDYVGKDAVRKQLSKDGRGPEKHPDKAAVDEIREKSEKLREASEELEKQVEKVVGKDIPTHADRRKGR